MTVYDKLVKMLFETKAFRVCEEGKPFWYTSNKIGPYYINTHFLYGSEEKANQLLDVINEKASDRENCSKIIFDLVLDNYNTDKIYKELIDMMVGYINKEINGDDFDYISGGERRDWFFSLMIAHLLKKPHITIYKDLTTTVFSSCNEYKNADHPKVLHVADIITVASSYTRAWIPAIKDFGGKMVDSLVVIDRLQGGKENLEGAGVRSHAMADVDHKLIQSAKDTGMITDSQFDLVLDYIERPYESMREFLTANPKFLNESLKSDKRTSERARICIDEDIYNLKGEK